MVVETQEHSGRNVLDGPEEAGLERTSGRLELDLLLGIALRLVMARFCWLISEALVETCCWQLSTCFSSVSLCSRQASSWTKAVSTLRRPRSVRAKAGPAAAD